MIRYSLRCAEGHGFESWFQSATAFDELSEKGLVACAVCGGTEVSKSLMAPGVATSERSGSVVQPEPQGEPTTAPPAEAPNAVSRKELERMIAKMRKVIEERSTYVGGRFAEEARAIHLGESEERMIHGEATPDEARELLEDGVPVAPLPFIPKDKSH